MVAISLIYGIVLRPNEISCGLICDEGGRRESRWLLRDRNGVDEKTKKTKLETEPHPDCWTEEIQIR